MTATESTQRESSFAFEASKRKSPNGTGHTGRVSISLRPYRAQIGVSRPKDDPLCNCEFHRFQFHPNDDLLIQNKSLLATGTANSTWDREIQLCAATSHSTRPDLCLAARRMIHTADVTPAGPIVLDPQRQTTGARNFFVRVEPADVTLNKHRQSIC